MKKHKLSEARIVELLQEGAEGKETVAILSRKYGVSEATYYKLKSKYGGMQVSDLKRLRELEQENFCLKKMYADASLDNTILKEVLEKKFPGLVERSLRKK